MNKALCTSTRLVSQSDGHKIQRNVSGEGYMWFWGCVRTPHGFVAVYADECITNLQIIIDSHEHEARIERGNISPRYLVTLARRFAQEVAL